MSELTTLRGGFTVPLDAVRLLLELEDRGLRIRLDADGAVLIGPQRHLTDADREAIRRYRDELRALIRYCEMSVQ